jgi:cytochrome b561
VHRIAGKHQVSIFGAFDWPLVIDSDEPSRLLSGSVHVALALLLIALITVHFGAVIKHLLINRDNILKCML